MRNRSMCLVPVFALVVVTSAASQVDWRKLSPSSPPAARRHFAMAADTWRNEIVVFGGEGGGLPTGTWAWDGFQWESRSVAVEPSPRTSVAMAFDSRRGVTVLFGGHVPPSVPVGDTWEWDGSVWEEVLPDTSPSPREGHSMVYDEDRNVVVLFGGINGRGAFRGDTWEFDGDDWREVTTERVPESRYRHKMAYDPKRRVAVLFGGVGPVAALDDTWEYDGSTWTQIDVSGPGGRSGFGMTYDRLRHRVVATSGAASDYWEYDGVAWELSITVGDPGGRTGPELAFDAVRQRPVLFGGSGCCFLNDTWEFVTLTAARYTTFGSGCAGAEGTPHLTASPSTLPWIGDAFEVRLANLPIAESTWFAFGVSKSVWGALTLPFGLEAFGLVGCDLLVSPDVVVPVANESGVAVMTVQIPLSLALVGFDYHNQGWVSSPGANPAGIVLSNGATARLGER